MIKWKKLQWLADTTVGFSSSYNLHEQSQLWLVPLLPQDSMSTPSQFTSSKQLGLDINDGSGLRVLHSQFQRAEKFNWELFQGFDSLRVLTYSASADAIVKMLDDFEFQQFDCVFGSEYTLGDFKKVLAFQKVLVEDTRAAIMKLQDSRHRRVLEQVQSGRASFRVMTSYVAHSKLYLLSAPGKYRVLSGSANLSLSAFGGRQAENLFCFDNDEAAWKHFNQLYDDIYRTATFKIELPAEMIREAEIEIVDAPILGPDLDEIIIPVPPGGSEAEHLQIHRVEQELAKIDRLLTPFLPPVRKGRQTITPVHRSRLRGIKLVKSPADADHRKFSLDRVHLTAAMDGKSYPLCWEEEEVRVDIALWCQYFENFQGAFVGDVPRLQRDYFTLMGWLYFAPFLCDLRAQAFALDLDVIQFPLWAIVYGKSNCGKTSLIDTLMTSMFGSAHTLEKQIFTTAQLRAVQQAYCRFPVVFDDIGRKAFNAHGKDLIKDELDPPTPEYPGILLSMNADQHSFPDEVMKRCLMIFTATALPVHDEKLRQDLQAKTQDIRRGLTGHFFRRYLTDVMRRLDTLDNTPPPDWLSLSTEVLHGLFALTGAPPRWSLPRTWVDYTEQRYDRVKSSLKEKLRPAAYVSSEGAVGEGWTRDGERVIVWETRDAFGRGEFAWDDVPSTIIDEEASSGKRKVLHATLLEQFMGEPLILPRRGWFQLRRNG